MRGLGGQAPPEHAGARPRVCTPSRRAACIRFDACEESAPIVDLDVARPRTSRDDPSQWPSTRASRCLSWRQSWELPTTTSRWWRRCLSGVARISDDQAMSVAPSTQGSMRVYELDSHADALEGKRRARHKKTNLGRGVVSAMGFSVSLHKRHHQATRSGACQVPRARAVACHPPMPSARRGQHQLGRSFELRLARTLRGSAKEKELCSYMADARGTISTTMQSGLYAFASKSGGAAPTWKAGVIGFSSRSHPYAATLTASALSFPCFRSLGRHICIGWHVCDDRLE